MWTARPRLHYSARAELVWQHDGQQYQARQISVLFLEFARADQWAISHRWACNPSLWRPLAQRKGRALRLCQGCGDVQRQYARRSHCPGAQDRLSVFLQLGAMFAAAPRALPGGYADQRPTVSSARPTPGCLPWAHRRRSTAHGPMRAVPLQRLPRRDYDQKAQLWLAPELGYLPVRIRITQANGDFAELNLRRSTARRERTGGPRKCPHLAQPPGFHGILGSVDAQAFELAATAAI